MTTSCKKEFEDIIEVIRQHNDQKKNDKKTNNDLQNIIHKTKDRVTRTPLKTGSEHRCSGRVGNSCSTSDKHS